jgi:hypothetical protein
MTNFVAIDPTTGAHVRAATPEETAAYVGQETRAAAGTYWHASRTFHRPLRVGDVLIDEYDDDRRPVDQGAWAWL